MAEPLPKLEIPFTEGDRLPPLTGTLKDTDLTGCEITLVITRPTDVIEKVATLDDDPTTGKYSFAWDDGDLVAGVGQECLLRFSDADDMRSTLLRFTIDVAVEPVVTEVAP